jgi:hypothetical protein
MTRMSIDVSHNLHMLIKTQSALHDESIKEFVIRAIEERLCSLKTINAQTKKTLSDADQGLHISTYTSVDDLYKKLGL